MQTNVRNVTVQSKFANRSGMSVLQMGQLSQPRVGVSKLLRAPLNAPGRTNNGTWHLVFVDTLNG
jgi:hypothetical protein